MLHLDGLDLIRGDAPSNRLERRLHKGYKDGRARAAEPATKPPCAATDGVRPLSFDVLDYLAALRPPGER